MVHGVGDGDIVAQDGYPLQSEGRTPGDEDIGALMSVLLLATTFSVPKRLWMHRMCWQT